MAYISHAQDSTDRGPQFETKQYLTYFLVNAIFDSVQKRTRCDAGVSLLCSSTNSKICNGIVGEKHLVIVLPPTETVPWFPMGFSSFISAVNN